MKPSQEQFYLGIPLTGVATRCSLSRHGGLPEESVGAGAAIFDGRPVESICTSCVGQRVSGARAVGTRKPGIRKTG